MSNIFESLGLPENHRQLSNKVTQYVKHWDEVIEKHKINKNLCVQVKKDGVCSLTIVDDQGNVSIWSRTGKLFTNTQELVAKIHMLGLHSGVYMGEVTCDYVSLEVLSGVVNPNRTNKLTIDLAAIPAALNIDFFDYISIDEFKSGKSDLPFAERFYILEAEYVRVMDKFSNWHPHIHLLPYIDVESEIDIRYILNDAVIHGEEGVVIRDMDADWEAGHKGYRVMKLVKGVDYDLTCVGYEEGAGKYKGKVANLIFAWKDGKTIKAMLGKGWTHDMAEFMFSQIVLCKDTPVGKVFQVYALEESSKGKLRLPKVGECRFDKEEADV